MAATGTPTPNLGLRIPVGTDPASVDDINYNSNLLDTVLGAVGNKSVKDQLDELSDQIAKKVKIVSVQTTIPSGGTQAEFTITLPSAESNTNYVPFVFGRGGNTAYIPVFTVSSWTTTQITGVVYNCGVSTAVATRDVHVMLVR